MKKYIVLSGANIINGGPLQVYRTILATICHTYPDMQVIAIVNRKDLFDTNFKNLIFLEYRWYKKIILLKFFYEYIYFYFVSRKYEIELWLSLNDCTPTVNARRRAVYCHNATPFYNRTLKDYLNPTIAFLQSFYYVIFYRINLKRNDFIIVQQLWIKKFFLDKFKIVEKKIIVNYPVENLENKSHTLHNNQESYIFIYPTKAQPYKNVEVIFKAIDLLEEKGVTDFIFNVTIKGDENRYAQRLSKHFGHLKSVRWIGTVERGTLETLYENSSCLIFSSKLETWGLPITEYKIYNRPILLSNLPYSKETLGDYEYAKFFNPDDHYQLSEYMERLIRKERFPFDATQNFIREYPFASNTPELLNILLGK